MASQCLSKDDTWKSILEKELMEKSTITPRTLSILKDNHEYCDPNVLMNLRHDKSANPLPKQRRESISSIMETARRNLKMEYNEKASGAMHRKMIDNEVEKFKQHLTRLRRINVSSNRPLARKPLRVRFQRMAIRSRSCGSSVAKPKRNSDFPGGGEPNFFHPSPTSEFHWVDKSRSVHPSLNTDVSLPAVYGNSVYEATDFERGPNTTPVSFLSSILPQPLQEGNFLLEQEFLPEEFCEGDSLSPSPEPRPADIKAEELRGCAECCDFNSAGGKPHEDHQLSDSKVEVLLETASKAENERKRKLKNNAYTQFMSYVCNKSVRVPRVQQSATVSPQIEDEESALKREEKIAMVLCYLQRKKNSPDTSQSETPPEPVTKERTKLTPAVSHDPKTVRINGGPYEHRYQAQRDVIKKQKMQLEEQQKKIQELTLAKLQEEAKSSQKDFQKKIDELEDDCTLSIRPQLRTLKGSGQPDFASAGKIVERMERRAKEREEKKLIAAERRKLQEEERKKRIQEEGEKQRKEEEGKKREAFEKIREENIRQREMRDRTRKEQERMLELHKQAEFFNKRRLCKKGLRAFRRLLLCRDELLERAGEYYTNRILKMVIYAWKRWVDDQIAQKLSVADGFYNRILLRNSFNSWKKELTDAVRKRQVAEDMYEMRLQERVFRRWSEYVNQQHVRMAEELETADEYYTWVLLKKGFNTWRAYPKVARLEREKEQRKKILRQKVQDMLPDFQPVSPQF